MNTNIQGDFYCKFCGKHSTTKQGNSIHENRCKQNPNGFILLTKNGISKRVLISEKTDYLNTGWQTISNFHNSSHLGTKNKILINDGTNHKFILPEQLDEHLTNGWKRGYTDSQKQKYYGSTGICSDPEKEKLRKLKISETMKKNPKAGGYRKGSGIGSKGYFNNIYCDSTWELAFVVYHIENELYIERCKEKRKYIFNNEEHFYYPDFITSEGIVEIKGFSSKQWEAKYKYNQDIKVLYKDDMKKYLDYVIEKYGEHFDKILYNK